MTKKLQIRNMVRKALNHEPVSPPKGDPAARRQAQRAAENESWAKGEAAAQKRAKLDQMVADEILRVRLERGPIGFD
jgi:hypothetical protein